MSVSGSEFADSNRLAFDRSRAPHFATSRAHEIFLRDLRRYTLEEVAGRSFLIAGHRGADKTALVMQAIDTKSH